MSTISRDDVLATEQSSVDHAYDCYEARLAELDGDSVARASASGKDSVAVKQEAEQRAAAYGGLGAESLVIGRVDVTEPDEGAQTWYIGRRGVRDDQNDPVVLLWTTPLAKKWYEAKPEAPGDVLLLRRLRCEQRKVTGYSDDIAVAGHVPAARPPADDPAVDADAAVPGAPVADPRRTGPSPGDVARIQRRKPRQPDDFLLRELQRARRGTMRDIVETIRRDQMALVTGSPSEVLIVQGGPGTGKTAVGLHRVTWLVNNDHFKASDILVVGPHQMFLNYVGQVLPTLGTRDVNAVQLNRLWDDEAPGVDTMAVSRVKSDARMAEVLRRRVERDCNLDAVDALLTAPSHADDEPTFTVNLGSTVLRLPREELVALVVEARDADGAFRERRDRFRTRLVDRLLQRLVDIAPRRARDNSVRRSMERNRVVERLVDRVWNSPGPRETLRSLYDSPELLRACAEGLLDEDEQAALHRPRAARADDELWTLDDQVCLEELGHLITGDTPRRYGHIVIDEAQDLTPMQARSLRRRVAARGSMTVLGDLAQATGPHHHPAWDLLGGLLSDHGDWNVARLNTSYRVPAEIMRFAAPLARAVAPDLPYPQAVREAGADAVRVVPTDTENLLAEVLTRVGALADTTDGHGAPRSVAVIVPDASDWQERITRALENDASTATLPDPSAVSVIGAGQAKGMEYDHVIVVEPTAIAEHEDAGLRRLYIALTRSTQTLTVLHTTKLPAALTETPVDAAGDESIPSPEEESAGAELLEIGSTLRVRVEGHRGGHCTVTALNLSTGRPLRLASRGHSTPPATGTELEVWVLRHAAGATFVTADTHGRKPISPTMARRYIAALTAVEEIVEGTIPPNGRERLSELKGMANRCLRRDQHDWLDVWRILGKPDTPRLEALRDLAHGVGRQLAPSAHADAESLRAIVRQSDWTPVLAAARTALEARNPTVDPLTEPEPQEQAKPAAQPTPEEPAPVATTEAAPETAAALRDSLATAARTDRTCKTHEAVRHELMAALLRADLQPTTTDLADVTCTTPDGEVLYEVLGSGRTTYQDLREGAVRILELHYVLAGRFDARCLVLSEPPTEPWAAEAVSSTFGVGLLWRTTDGWGGTASTAFQH
ncbi:HelD family protein [Streptomyces sp. NPDC059524]|uniref:HelD family protein n=1 Tax=Streptomyces sp. NPDC059524 TaxID=3346856 RepID=UPI0036C4ECEB